MVILMFKVSIEQVDKTANEEIIIKCHEINDDVLSIVNKLKEKQQEMAAQTPQPGMQMQ